MLGSQPDGDSKLQGLKLQCKSLLDNPSFDETKRRDVEDAVRHAEEKWTKVLRAAKEAFSKAEAEAATERDFNVFKTQSDSIQLWIREQRQKLSQAFGSHMPFEERLQIAQVS